MYREEVFFIDKSRSHSVSWSKLIDELNRVDDFNSYCYESDFYEVFKQIIISLLLKQEIILLDADFSEDEIVNLVGSYVLKNKQDVFKIKGLAISSKEDLLLRINENRTDSSWKITLFTSGTTGIPKKVSHSFTSIARFVKQSENNSSNVWGFAYNPTHMAGIQVFFQALLNGNAIIRLFNLDKKMILDLIESFSITHISATPTFYRLLLPIDTQFDTVRRITSGGEKFDNKVMESLKWIFPKAKFTNVYASTEAGTLLASNGNEFTIKVGFEHLIKIEDEELLIHQSLMGDFDSQNSNQWYHTGDLVEIIKTNPAISFRFLSRKNEMINVGGYKVNPIEVEDAIRTIGGIRDVRVFAKKNSILGSIICCEIVSINPELDELAIRTILQSKLQEYKIPRMIKFVDKLQTTRTGKIKRN